MILVGSAGASSSTSPNASSCPLGLVAPNISPSCTEMPDGVSVPKLALPWWRKRIQLVTPAIAVVKSGDPRALRNQRQYRVKCRRLNFRQTPHFLNHSDQRVDLHRAVAF